MTSLVKEYNDEVIEAYKQQPGFRFAQLWVHRDTLKVTSVTGWDSNAALLQATKDPAYAKAMQNIAAFLHGKPEPETMEVVVEARRTVSSF